MRWVNAGGIRVVQFVNRRLRNRRQLSMPASFRDPSAVERASTIRPISNRFDLRRAYAGASVSYRWPQRTRTPSWRSACRNSRYDTAAAMPVMVGDRMDFITMKPPIEELVRSQTVPSAFMK